MKIQFLKKWGLELSVLASGIILGGAALLASCVTPDVNLTSKKINCNQVSAYSAAICCLQFMSSKTGSDSKDAVCRPLIDELTTRLEAERKKEMLQFCDKRQQIKQCLDLTIGRR